MVMGVFVAPQKCDCPKMTWTSHEMFKGAGYWGLFGNRGAFVTNGEQKQETLINGPPIAVQHETATN